MIDDWEQMSELIREMYQASPEEARGVCRRLLRKSLIHGLTPVVWDVLESIVDLEHLWTWTELPVLLGQYRLPTDRDGLRDACAQNAGTGRTSY
jgi:hypothetical protein